MRVALVSHRFKRGDGQGRVNLEVAQEALRRGWHVELIASDVSAELLHEKNLTWTRVPVAGWPSELLRNQIFALRSALYLRARRPAIDLLMVNGFITWCKADFNAAHFIHASWLASPHRALEGGSTLRRIYQWIYTALNARLERAAYVKARRVVAISPSIRRELLAIGVPASRILTIDNGVDTTEFTPGPTDRLQLGLPPGKPVALFVGDLQLPRKNLHTVLAALVDCPGLHLAVVGRIGNSPYPELARALGIADRVAFLDYRRDVPQLMRSVDFVVFPSLYEPSGLVLLEAMASGVPVVTSGQVGGIESAGSDGIILVKDPQDPHELAGVLRSLVERPDERRLLGQAGRRRALALDFRSMAARYCDAFADHGHASDGDTRAGSAKP